MDKDNKDKFDFQLYYLKLKRYIFCDWIKSEQIN